MLSISYRFCSNFIALFSDKATIENDGDRESKCPQPPTTVAAATLENSSLDNRTTTVTTEQYDAVESHSVLKIAAGGGEDSGLQPNTTTDNRSKMEIDNGAIDCYAMAASPLDYTNGIGETDSHYDPETMMAEMSITDPPVNEATEECK